MKRCWTKWGVSSAVWSRSRTVRCAEASAKPSRRSSSAAATAARHRRRVGRTRHARAVVRPVRLRRGGHSARPARYPRINFPQRIFSAQILRDCFPKRPGSENRHFIACCRPFDSGCGGCRGGFGPHPPPGVYTMPTARPDRMPVAVFALRPAEARGCRTG